MNPRDENETMTREWLDSFYCLLSLRRCEGKMDEWLRLQADAVLSLQVAGGQPGSGQLLQQGEAPGPGRQLGAGEESKGLLHRGE